MTRYLSIAALALGLTELLMFLRLLRKYGLRFGDDPASWISRAPLSDWLRARAHIVNMLFMFNLSGILAYMR